MELDSPPELLFSYDWTCPECTRCAVCDKTKEVRALRVRSLTLTPGTDGHDPV
jgi:hypothetical protein